MTEYHMEHLLVRYDEETGEETEQDITVYYDWTPRDPEVGIMSGYAGIEWAEDAEGNEVELTGEEDRYLADLATETHYDNHPGPPANRYIF